MTLQKYKGPFPPKGCIQERFALFEKIDGLLYKIRGGSAVFWFASGEAVQIEDWRYEDRLQILM